MAIDWDRPQRVPLEVLPKMPKHRQVARRIYNAQMAYLDTMCVLEHELAAAHFDAVGCGDKAGAEAALRARIAAGFEVD
jgi:hypothetical protein